MQDYYVIDFDKRIPEILIYDASTIKEDLIYFKAKNISELDSPDWKIFKTEREAENFLARYNAIKLDNSKHCISRDLPCMLLKRKYMIQTLMNEKMTTCREYRKNWNAGQLFNFHDQVYFVTCRLISIKEKLDDEGVYYEYSFELAK